MFSLTDVDADLEPHSVVVVRQYRVVCNIKMSLLETSLKCVEHRTPMNTLWGHFEKYNQYYESNAMIERNSSVSIDKICTYVIWLTTCVI